MVVYWLCCPHMWSRNKINSVLATITSGTEMWVDVRLAYLADLAFAAWLAAAPAVIEVLLMLLLLLLLLLLLKMVPLLPTVVLYTTQYHNVKEPAHNIICTESVVAAGATYNSLNLSYLHYIFIYITLHHKKNENNLVLGTSIQL